MRNLIVALVMLTNAPVFAECLDGSWTHVDGSTMMALRSNGCHYWAWAATYAKRLLPPAWLKATVIVTGDPHHENFSHFNMGGKRVYLPNDLDDTGEAPAILELFKFMGVARSVQEDDDKMSFQEVGDSYFAGLIGKRYSGDFPRWLENDRDVSERKVKEDEQEDVDRRTSGNQLKEKDSLVTWRNMSTVQRRELEQLDRALIAGVLPRGWEVLDRGIHTKGERGGSQGLKRYWYLLREREGQMHIVEFKQMREPAVALYQNQPGSLQARLKKSLNVYWGSTLPPLFGVLSSGNQVFWMRPKLPNYVNFSVDEFRGHKKKFAELTYFIAYNLGRWHGSQLKPAEIDRLVAERRAITEGAVKFVDEYLQDVRKERRE